jgi:hypothetical protein
LLAQACGSDSINGTSRGSLSGTVALQDTWGNDLADNSGVEVTVDGTTSRAVTDNAGSWHIDDIPAGRHDIVFKKPSFGTMRVPDQPIIGASTVPTIAMAVTPTVQAVIDSIHISNLSGMAFYFVDGHFSSPPPANAKSSVAIIFIGKTDGVSPELTSYDQWNASFNLGGGSATFTIPLPVDGTRSTFGAGNTVFVTGYANSVACGCYNDVATKKRVFANTGPRGNVVKLTIE